ncbi:RlpA-like double-psi beta-barrel-protein domain-containing protein-containing protein [Apiospora rasikravindrae]|uniref:RlpA-like double-psi beta-barrel-protein domain-containing protein-containing protein n=1 Tax=Apiospora rasikravindrae TaxID=990691 RepID=A0ABR1TBM0_9PEZI
MQFFTTLILAAASFAAAAPAEGSSPKLEARAFSGDMTYYDAGLGACGQTNNNNDAIVALPSHFFTASNPNQDPLCNRNIRITYQGKSTTAKIVDKCAGCSGNSIDVTPSVFTTLVGGLGAGRVQVTWDYV